MTMVRIDKGKSESMIGRTWTWVAKIGDGRVRMVTFQMRARWSDDSYTFRARINGGPNWYVIEDDCIRERMNELRILYRNAMTHQRFIETYSDIFLSQSGQVPHIGSGV